ncbi:hypothetical protein [Aeromicrobium sp.]|uniref:hypothetical protein n=1 Tax=Aeromicrobium sp. TaxID=1871063 RepID=UPI0028AB3690|nr:hypothetical protein [Aeromicrobium sp.]
MRSRAWAAVGAVPVLLVLAGCGESAYEATRACSIPAGTVEAVLGTDRFTAGAERVEQLPFTTQSTRGSAACRVDAGDVSFTVKAEILPAGQAERLGKDLQREEDSYPLLGGTARADDRGGSWACGSVSVTAWLDGERSADPDEMGEALEAVAQEATCYTAS